MIRYLVDLGLALVAILAMSIVVASVALAQQGKLIADGPATLSLTEIGAAGSGANALTAFGGKMECPASTYTGHEAKKTPHGLIPSGSTESTITPTYVNCFSELSGSTFSSTVDMNGCDYLLHIGETAGGEHTYGATADIECPEGKSIQVTAFIGPSHVTKVCTLTIGAINGLSGVYITTTTASNDIELKGTLVGINITQSGLCGAKETKEGALDIHMTIKGKDGEGKTTTVIVTDEAVPPGEGELTSDGPATLEAKENAGGMNKLTAFGGSFSCPGTVITGHDVGSTTKPIPVGAISATLSPLYGKCAMLDSGGNSFSTTVDMNNCDFVFNVGGTIVVMNTYEVTATVMCKNKGEHVQLTMFSSEGHALRLCTFTITAPEAGVTGPHLTTDTAKDDLDVRGTFGPFTVHKSGLCGAGEDKAATLHVDATITGKNVAGGSTGITVTDG